MFQMTGGKKTVQKNAIQRSWQIANVLNACKAQPISLQMCAGASKIKWRRTRPCAIQLLLAIISANFSNPPWDSILPGS